MDPQPATYDRIGSGYNTRRSADTRILERLEQLLNQRVGAAILDVGAGTGNYTKALAERGYRMRAVEPSQQMLEAAGEGSGIEWHQGAAEALPFADASFDAAYCTLALHHFADQRRGLQEIHRVLKPGGALVTFTSDPRRVPADFWMRHYFAELFEQAEAVFPAMADLVHQLRTVGFDRIVVEPYPIPSDNRDGFFCSAWQRPREYLDAGCRQGISSFRLMPAERVEEAIQRLAADLDSGQWQARYGFLLGQECYDGGYTFVSGMKPR